MAKSLEKKKPGSSLYEYGEKKINFYQNNAIRNDFINQTVNNQVNHTYYNPGENAGYKKTTKSSKRSANTRIIDRPANVYFANSSPSQPRFNSINKRK